jgi:hypothetical protein
VQVCPQVGADQGRKVLTGDRLTGKITYLLYILCIQGSGLFIAPRFSQYYFHYYCHYYCYYYHSSAALVGDLDLVAALLRFHVHQLRGEPVS